MNKKNIVLFIFFCVVIFGLILVGKNLPDRSVIQESTANKVSITASFYPLFYLANRIGGNAVDVQTVVPFGVEPHDFEPTPQDISSIQSSDLVLINGAGFDGWLEKMVGDLQSNNVSVIVMADTVDLLAGEEHHGEHHEEEGHEGEEAHDHGEFDPHIWLDPLRMQEMASQIREELISIDPTNAPLFEQNAAALQEELSGIHTRYQQGLSQCNENTIVVSHDAFGYIGNRYNVSIIPIAGISPQDEPSAQELKTIVDLMREQHVKFIFTEPLVSRKFVDTLAKEADVTTLMLNPIEGLTSEEQQKGVTYSTLMDDNLRNLREALDCQ